MGVIAEVAERASPNERRASTDLSDDGLVARVRAGDDSAFEAIYDRYARGILAFCAHMLGNRDAAEDALQLTFVSAYRALHRGNGQIALRPWLYTIARNRCLSELRIRRDVLSADGSVGEDSYVVGPAEHVQQRERLKEIFDDVQRLPPDQRAALVLFELGDHSHAEIATVLGVHRQKVKALIFQAREGLLRGRRARDSSCTEIREEIATIRGKPPARSLTRAHLDRCPACAAFEEGVRRHRAALMLIVPALPIGELRDWVLHSSLNAGHGIAAAGVGAGGSGTVIAGGGAGSGAAAGGLSSVGAGTAVSGMGVAAAGPSASAVATSVTAASAELSVVGGVVTPGSTGIVAKLVTAVAIASGVVGTGHAVRALPPPDASGLKPAVSVVAQPRDSGPAKPSPATNPSPPVVSTSSAVPVLAPVHPAPASTTAASTPVAPISNAAPTTPASPSTGSASSPPATGAQNPGSTTGPNSGPPPPPTTGPNPGTAGPDNGTTGPNPGTTGPDPGTGGSDPASAPPATDGPDTGSPPPPSTDPGQAPPPTDNPDPGATPPSSNPPDPGATPPPTTDPPPTPPPTTDPPPDTPPPPTTTDPPPAPPTTTNPPPAPPTTTDPPPGTTPPPTT